MAVLCLQCGVLAVVDEPSKGTQIGNCQFISSNGSSIDLTRVGKTGSARWEYQQTTSPSDPALYSYNPCYPFNQGNCQHAAVCRSDDERKNDVTVGLADTATFLYDEVNEGPPVIQYVAPAEIGQEAVMTLVTLHCQAANLEETLEVLGNTSANLYVMDLYSHCCCFGGCSSDITPSSKKLSFGSILCILFVCLATVYFIGGIMYMKCIRGAKGVEVIPNLSFWSDFPNLVMEGVIFVFTCGKGPSKSAYEDI